MLASERILQAVEREKQAYTLFLPQVSASFSQSRQTKNLQAFGIPTIGNASPLVGPFNSFDARIKVRQVVFDVAAINRLLSVRTAKDVSQFDEEKYRQDAMALGASLFLDALRTESNLKYSKILVWRDQKALQIAHRLFRSQQGTVTTVLEAKAAFKKSASQMRLAQIERSQALGDLKIALGYSLKEELTLDFVRLPFKFDVPAESELESLVEKNPDWEMAQTLVRQRQAERRISLAEYLPKLYLGADYGLSGKDPSENENTYTAGVEGQWNFFDGGLSLFKSKEAESRLKESELQLQTIRKNLSLSAQTSFENVLQAEMVLESAESYWISQERRAKDEKLKWDSGSGSEWAWVEAQSQFESAKHQKSEAEFLFLKSKVGFLRSLGRMDDLAGKSK